MDKQSVKTTQELWKDYPNTKNWIEALAHPEKHMIVNSDGSLTPDEDYRKAIESISYILGRPIYPAKSE